MNFESNEEVVFLRNESGTFTNDSGQKIDWYKVVFANPKTFENHELAYKPMIDSNFKAITKGEKILLELELEPTSKKSRVVVSNVQLV